MPGWDSRHAAQLPLHPPDAIAIRSALLVLTVMAFIVTYFCERKGPESIWAYLTFGYIMAMLVNVVVPHVPAAIVFRGYAPGVVTAVLVDLPLMSWLAWRAVKEKWVSGWKAVQFGTGVPVLAGIVIVAVFGTP